ncbi:MAG: hypothetical protein ACLU9S_13725 [Oscillospiraceae bacterium]
MDEVAKNMTYMELSTHPGYMDSFVAACFLPSHQPAPVPPQRSGGWNVITILKTQREVLLRA